MLSELHEKTNLVVGSCFHHILPGTQLEVGNVMITGLQAATACFVNMPCSAILLYIAELKSA